MGFNLILFVALIIETLSNGLAHVGEPCNRMIKICLTSHSYCDQNNICRCKSDYPVNVSPHTCKKGKHYGDQCRFSEECQYYDSNSYCEQSPYRSTCECYTSFSYSDSKKVCDEIVAETPKSTNIILPTAIGLSLAFACVFCCCMVFWHLCKRQQLGHWSFLSRNALSNNSTHDQNPADGFNSFLPQDEALPTYDTALSLKNDDEECEPPPSYEEVVGRSECSSKV